MVKSRLPGGLVTSGSAGQQAVQLTRETRVLEEVREGPRRSGGQQGDTGDRQHLVI